MRSVILSLSALFMVSCGGGGDPIQAPVETVAFDANYRVIAEDSAIRVSALQQGERFEGGFSEFDVAIRFDPDDLEGSRVVARIPVRSLDLGHADRNDAVPGKVWFNAGAHPVATFVSDSISRDGDGYVAQGDLTVKGLRRPVRLPFTLTQDGDRTVMNGGVELDRNTWNLGEAPWDTEEWVSRAVQVDITLTAEETD